MSSLNLFGVIHMTFNMSLVSLRLLTRISRQWSLYIMAPWVQWLSSFGFLDILTEPNAYVTYIHTYMYVCLHLYIYVYICMYTCGGMFHIICKHTCMFRQVCTGFYIPHHEDCVSSIIHRWSMKHSYYISTYCILIMATLNTHIIRACVFKVANIQGHFFKFVNFNAV